MSQSIDNKTTFPDTHRHSRPAMNSQSGGLQLKKNIFRTKDARIRNQRNIINLFVLLFISPETCQNIGGWG